MPRDEPKPTWRQPYRHKLFYQQMESKRLGLLHELAPKVDLIAALLNPNNPFFDNQLKDVDEASRALNLKVQIERASNQRDIALAFKKFEELNAGALLVGADPYFNSQRALVIDPAIRLRLPAIYEWREFVEDGGLMRYGTSLTEAYRQALQNFMMSLVIFDKSSICALPIDTR